MLVQYNLHKSFVFTFNHDQGYIANLIIISPYLIDTYSIKWILYKKKLSNRNDKPTVLISIKYIKSMVVICLLSKVTYKVPYQTACE